MPLNNFPSSLGPPAISHHPLRRVCFKLHSHEVKKGSAKENEYRDTGESYGVEAKVK